MGNIYFISCKACKVTRDLDKLKLKTIANRHEALALAGILETKATLYREGLLLSFMSEHIGHEVVLHCDAGWDSDADRMDEATGFREDGDFW